MTNEKTDTRRMKAVFVLTATLAFVTSPLWSAGFGGFDANAYPNPQNDPPIQPAGYAFSIWGVIYLWLVVSSGYGLFARADDAEWDRVRWPLTVSLIVGAPWISVAVISPVWATVMIWVMLISALWALFVAPAEDRWLLAAPIALYAGWLSAASLVALGLLGAGYGVIAGETGWAWAMLLAALVLATAVQKNVAWMPVYSVGVVWALIAVAVRNWPGDPALAMLAIFGAGWLAWSAARGQATAQA
ncbi:MAG: hypothetical protein AAFV31_17245 [Pseudomonadota bacterium]